MSEACLLAAPTARPPSDACSESHAPGGTRIRLRLLDESDRGLYHALHASPEVMRTVGPPLAADEIEARLGRVLRHNRAASPGHRAWAIECMQDVPPRVGLVALLRDGERAELGIMLLPAAWRRGIAAAAIATVLLHAFDRMGRRQVDASRPHDEHAVIIDRLLARFGFKPAPGLRPGEAGWCLPRCRFRGGPGV